MIDVGKVLLGQNNINNTKPAIKEALPSRANSSSKSNNFGSVLKDKTKEAVKDLIKSEVQENVTSSEQAVMAAGMSQATEPKLANQQQEQPADNNPEAGEKITLVTDKETAALQVLNLKPTTTGVTTSMPELPKTNPEGMTVQQDEPTAEDRLQADNTKSEQPKIAQVDLQALSRELGVDIAKLAKEAVTAQTEIKQEPTSVATNDLATQESPKQTLEQVATTDITEVEQPIVTTQNTTAKVATTNNFAEELTAVEPKHNQQQDVTQVAKSVDSNDELVGKIVKELQDKTITGVAQALSNNDKVQMVAADKLATSLGLLQSKADINLVKLNLIDKINHDDTKMTEAPATTVAAATVAQAMTMADSLDSQANQNDNSNEAIAAIGAMKANSTMQTTGKDFVAELKDITAELDMSQDKLQVARQLVENVRLMQRAGSTEMLIRLKPENLGEIVLKVSFANGNLNANFHTNNQESRAILEAAMPQLRQELSHSGFKVHEVGVYAGMSQDFMSKDQGGKDALADKQNSNRQKQLAAQKLAKLDLNEELQDITVQDLIDNSVDYKI